MPASLLVTTADYTSTANATWHTVPGLDFNVVAGTTYAFEYNLYIIGSVIGTGHILGCLGPASPTYLRYTWVVGAGAAAVALGGSNVYDHTIAAPANSVSGTAANPGLSFVKGTIIPSASGTLSCRIRPEVAATVVVLRGSYALVANP